MNKDLELSKSEDSNKHIDKKMEEYYSGQETRDKTVS